MLTIRKNGNKNFVHQDSNYNDYGANDITVIFDGNYVKLRSVTGRVIFNREGYLFSDVTVFDVSGGGQVFANTNDLKQALIDLGYPFKGGITGIEINEIDGGTL